MAQVITGLFATPAEGERALNMLMQRGFRRDEISIAASENAATGAFAVDSHSKVAEGTAIGAGTGGAIGALVIGLTSVGVIATSGIGLLAAGPIVAVLAGLGAGAAAGGVVGGLVGLSIPEHEVKYYEEALEKGSVLLGVEAEGERKTTARDVFKSCNALKISNA